MSAPYDWDLEDADTDPTPVDGTPRPVEVEDCPSCRMFGQARHCGVCGGTGKLEARP